MKKITKICAVVAACLATIGLTGCPDVAASIGKDDFYGTWITLDIEDGETPKTVYKNVNGTGDAKDKYYSITWNFDGKAEDMFNGTGGTFWQHLVRYSNEAKTTVENETFWYGEYAIKGNSGYSKGKLYLYYECGYDIDDKVRADNGGNYDAVAAKTLFYELAGIQDATLGTDNVAWKTADFLNRAFNNTDGLGNLTNDELTALAYYQQNKNGALSYDTDFYNGAYVANNVTIQVRKKDNKFQCSDVEYFRFNLKDGSASGYTRMMATVLDTNGTSTIGGIYNQWATASDVTNGKIGANISSTEKKFDGGFKVKNGCSWSGATTRYMGRISVKSTPADPNPEWKYSITDTNEELFNLVDNRDHTDYSDVNSNISAEE